MSRHSLAAAVVLFAFGCTDSPSQLGAVLSGPEVQTATTACEQRFADRELSSMAQVADCERTIALPREEEQQPGLSPMYQGLWRDKIALYAKVDRGQLTKAEADRRIAIEADNWFTNIQSVERGSR